jgi:hypothetical protein
MKWRTSGGATSSLAPHGKIFGSTRVSRHSWWQPGRSIVSEKRPIGRSLDVARRRVEQVREAGFDKPLTWGGEYPSLGARRAVQYSKGALFMAHLRETIGEAAFWNGLRSFTQQHAGGTVTSKDFQHAMETTSGRDLSSTFAEWVYGR